MQTNNCLIGCTDGYYGSGAYDPKKKYIIYNDQKYKNQLKNIFKRKNKEELMKDGFPDIWTEEFVNVHNCSIASSVVIHRTIMDKVGPFSIQLWAPDYHYWKMAMKHTKMSYVNEPLMYYDSGHGDGQNY